VSSLRETATECTGESTPVSVLEDVFDYQLGPDRPLSLGDQLDRVRGQSFGINVIGVCPESFSTADVRDIEEAIQEARDLFAQVGVGIRAVEWYRIDAGDANGHCELGDDGSPIAEARALTNDWTIDNDLMDLFVVRNFTGRGGRSAIDGDCDKSTGSCESGMSGSVVELISPAATMGILMAHELGHYFGLEHTSRTNNFMNPTVGTANTGITTSQGSVVRGKDCFTEEVC
jgi:hypothetical protein